MLNASPEKPENINQTEEKEEEITNAVLNYRGRLTNYC